MRPMSSRANQCSFFLKGKLERNCVRGQTWERVLLSSQDPLGVIDQVHRENQGDQSTPDCVEDAPGRKFSGWDHCSINTTFFNFFKKLRNFAALPVSLPENKGCDSEDKDNPPESPEIHGAPCEIPLGLKGEQSQGQTQGGGYGHCHPNPLSLMENCKRNYKFQNLCLCYTLSSRWQATKY